MPEVVVKVDLMSLDCFQTEIIVSTRGKGTYEITDQIESFVSECDVSTGQITVFLRHTSASLVIMENADPSARDDLHSFFDNIVPDNLPYLVHTYEGPDDSPSHLKMALTRTAEVIPISEGRTVLGTWQGVFVFEHRVSPHLSLIHI